MVSPDTRPVRNVLTVDVEDYFHVSAFRHSIRIDDWDGIESRISRNTRKALELLAEFNLKVTFFILGWVADRYPGLVREIQSAGHELGCHSYDHRLIYDITPEEFRADTARALRSIEDASGTPVRLYRAPSFSITSRSLWAIEILLELGFSVDRSITSLRTGLYGIATAPRQAFRILVHVKELLEFPMTTMRINKWSFPVTGGVYLRLLPLLYQRLALATIAKRGEFAILHFHPWELDTEQPRLAAPATWRMIHYARLYQTENRLRQLFARFRFGKLSDLMRTSAPLCEIKPVDATGDEEPLFKWLAEDSHLIPASSRAAL
jgi:polysaccharide deacetylase family protein (PEP-CTERM system associated)